MALGVRARWKGNKDLSSVFNRWSRRVYRRHRKMIRQQLWKEGKKLQAKMSRWLSAKVGISKAAAKRRLQLYRNKKMWSRQFFAIRVGRSSAIIHAGRLSGVRTRGRRVTRIPGVQTEDAFLFRMNSYKGKHRRIYERTPDGQGIRAVAFPASVALAFYDVGRPEQDKIIRRLKGRVVRSFVYGK